MRFSSAAILILILATAAAQRPGGGISRGGIRPGPPSLSSGNPFTRPNGSFGPGFGSGLGGQLGLGQQWGFYPHQQRPFGNSLFFSGPIFAPNPAYPPYTPDYPQWPPDEGPWFPQADVTQVPTTMSQPVTNQDTHLNALDGEPNVEPCGASTSGTSGFHFYQVPVPPSSDNPDNDDHPPLIALKNGSAYSALRYWVKGKVFHFITSLGDNMQVPVTQVERIYPSSRHSQVTDPQSSPAK